jgi:DNA-directed RNA polymerase subunit RPC12/RpoP
METETKTERKVKCFKCGTEVELPLPPGWEKDAKGNFFCPHCVYEAKKIKGGE